MEHDLIFFFSRICHQSLDLFFLLLSTKDLDRAAFEKKDLAAMTKHSFECPPKIC